MPEVHKRFENPHERSLVWQCPDQQCPIVSIR